MLCKSFLCTMTKGDSSGSASGLSRIWNGLKKVTVEPPSLFIMTCALMNYLLSQDLLIEKACRVNLNYASEVCDSIRIRNNSANYSAEETEIQIVVAKVRTYRSIIDHGIPIVIVLFLGPWSDRYGRKLPLLIVLNLSIFLNPPCVGYFLQAAVFMLFSWMQTVDAFTVGIVASAITNLCGGLTTFTMSTNSHLVDITSNEERTVRIGILNAFRQIGVPIGFAIGGALSTSKLGDIASFSISAAFAAAAFFEILFTVDTSARIKKDQDVPNSLKFAKNNILQVFKLPFIKRKGNERTRIILLLLAYICITAPFHGEFGVMYLFLRKQFGWNAGNYGIFSTYNFVIGVVGTMVSMGVLSHAMKLSDPLIGFLSGISQLTSCFIYAFAYSTLMIYLAPTVDLMNGSMTIVVKSMLSKLIHSDENGKLFSFVGLLDSLIPLAMDPTYSTIYRLTINVFAGSFFFLSAFVTIPPQIIFLLFIYKKWTDSSEVKNPERTIEEQKSATCPNPTLNNSTVSISTSTSTVDTDSTDC